MQKKNSVQIARVVSEIFGGQTDILITILRNRCRGQSDVQCVRNNYAEHFQAETKNAFLQAATNIIRRRCNVSLTLKSTNKCQDFYLLTFGELRRSSTSSITRVVAADYYFIL